MAQASRPLIAVVVVAFVLVAAYLLVATPAPKPPDRSKTPFAPIEAIQPAQDASAASEEANRRLQAAGDAVEAP
jgi:hypothetical protein